MSERAVLTRTQVGAVNAPAVPLMPEIGVVALVPDLWGGPWMSRHHILTRLGRRFNVVWLDPARDWREWWLPGQWRPGPIEVCDLRVPQGTGFMLYRPGRWLPAVYRPQSVAMLLTRLRLERARRLLRARGARSIVLYLWRPDFAPVLDLLPHAMSCYHIVDEYSFSAVEQPMDTREERLIRRVDQVFIHSQALAEKKGHLNPRTLVVPNGVDYRAFATPTPVPDDLKLIPRPRIGYVGVIKEQLDFELLASVARRHPEWSFVFVGPSRVEHLPTARALTGMHNVFFLGPRPASELPGYMQHMDVCTMAYVMDDYTKFIYPLKLNEYLASGRPVVGTPIRALRSMSDVVRLAKTTDEWSVALRAALAPESNSDQAVAERRALARAHDWEDHVDVIVEAIRGRLDEVTGAHNNHARPSLSKRSPGP